jgi:hypothetical protein
MSFGVRVAVVFGEVGHHRVQDPVVDGGGRLVVEVLHLIASGKSKEWPAAENGPSGEKSDKILHSLNYYDIILTLVVINAANQEEHDAGE